ncbi:MAG: hypothetical protein JXA11_00975 [Phycisphaerae bacterium]|nr:hypothetical protein [Phycisphaerae bacterium]
MRKPCSRGFFVPEFGEATPFDVNLIDIDFESQEFFSGSNPVSNLGFFINLFGMELKPGIFGAVEVDFGEVYQFVGTKITVVPEPNTMMAGIAALGALVTFTRRRIRISVKTD